MFNCDQCSKQLSNKFSLKRHIDSVHSNITYTCQICGNRLKRKDALQRHLEQHQHEPTSKIRREAEDVLNNLVNTVSRETDSALNGAIKSYKIFPEDDDLDPVHFLNKHILQIQEIVTEQLNTPQAGFKMQLCLTLTLFKPIHPEETTKAHFRSRQHVMLKGTELSPEIESCFPKILESVSSFQREGSGWAIKAINSLDVILVEYRPLDASTYKPLPKRLKDKHAIINVQNSDNYCFKYCVLAALYPQEKNAERVSKYQMYNNVLSFEGISFPMKTDDIGKFEKLNSLAINVYGFEDNAVYPLKISKLEDCQIINLLLHDGHYSLIKDLNRLLFDIRKDKHRKYFCPRCLTSRYTESLLEEHILLCKQQKPTRICMPDQDTMEFSNFNRMLRQPLIVYADLECLTLSIDPASDNGRYQRHVPCGAGLVEVLRCCEASETSDPIIFRSTNCVEQFLLELLKISIVYHQRLDQPKDVNGFDATLHQSNICHICQKLIHKDKVIEHCHICGRYRGPAHNECNVKYCLNRDIIVVFHNLRRYDGHILMQEIGQFCKLHGFNINVVAKSIEDYISFSLIHCKEFHLEKGWKIKFIDSLQFLNSSLGALVDNLSKDQFNILAGHFGTNNLDVLTRKQVYPYDYMNDWSCFDKTELPLYQEFYNKLNNELVSSEDYLHAQKVWKLFGIKNMGDFHDLYLTVDVLLLADVFEQFRKFGLQNYQLDPAHYVTLPSLAWDACLLMTGVTLELLQDSEMYLFFESAKRGGVSMISHRYAKANNPYLEDFNPGDPTSYIIYLDKNNLYGWGMTQPMPKDGFIWLSENQISGINWLEIPSDSPIGYMLEVDLDYPTHLHTSHDAYPLAPEHMCVEKLSPYASALQNQLNLKSINVKKLIPNLHNKKRYILHYRNLQLYIRLGLQLTAVHRVIQFNQSRWIEKYIVCNTLKRSQATNNFEKNLLKLLNNAIFGKSCENPRRYKNVQLVTTDYELRKLTRMPRFQSATIFNTNLVGVCSLQPSTCLCKPVYCGVSILDITKAHMYEFHYDYVLPKYGDQAKLLFTDTDSFCYQVKTNDVYEDMQTDGHHFDFSDYNPTSRFYSTVNKKVVGKMKDETSGVPIIEFCGLRPKLYSFKTPFKEVKKAKGIKKNVISRDITHKDYTDTLFGEGSMVHSMNLIQSKRHQIFSVTVKKRGLCAFDDKRYLLDAIESISYGNHLLH